LKALAGAAHPKASANWVWANGPTISFRNGELKLALI